MPAPVASVVDFNAIRRALQRDDLEAALVAGLLAWDGMPVCDGSAIGFDPGTWAWLRAARDARMQALAARTRMQSRNARLSEQRRARAQRLLDAAPTASANPPTPAATTSAAPQADPAPPQPAASSSSPTLPDAARAALARALAKAGTPRH